MTGDRRQLIDGRYANGQCSGWELRAGVWGVCEPEEGVRGPDELLRLRSAVVDRAPLPAFNIHTDHRNNICPPTHTPSRRCLRPGLARSPW